MDDDRKSKVRLKGELDVLRKQFSEVERLYQSLIKSNLYGMQEIDIYGNITYINEVQCRILGYDGGALKGQEIWDLLASDPDRKSLTDYLTAITQQGHSQEIWTGMYKMKNEEIVELSQHWNYRKDEQGNVTGYICVTAGLGNTDKNSDCDNDFDIDLDEEIDDMDQTQAWMVGKDTYYQLIAESATEMFVIFNMDGKIKFVNEFGLNLIGYFEEELLDMSITDFLPPEAVEKIKNALLKQHKAGIKDIILIDGEIINRNLKLLPMEISLSLIVKAGKPSEILIIGREIEKQKKRKLK